MSKLDFSSMNDTDLLKMEYNLQLELDASLVNMVYNENLDSIYEQLEDINVEKEGRGLGNG